MKLRRILSLILACSLAVTMFTVIPAAAEDTVITQNNPSGTLTITLKIKGTASVTTAPTAKEGLTTSNGNAVELLETPGTAEGGTMAYSLNGTDYSADIPTADAAGTYTVYYKAIGDEDHNDSEAQTLTVTITLEIKPDAAVTAAPTAKEGLTISNGAAVELLETPGTAEGGTMAYSLNGTDYSADIPTADAAGTYTVYYKAIGDEDHNDSEAQTLTVTVGASGALTITLVIEEPSYTITWKNGDTVLETDTDVAEGTTPTYDGTTPEKAEDENYTYTFSGWTDGETTYAPDAIPAVTGNVTYTATFTPQEKPFSVKVRKLTGEVYTIQNVTRETTVAELKTLVAAETAIPASEQRLIFAGKELADDKTLGEYNIGKDATLNLVVRTYTVTWMNGETVLETSTGLLAGDIPSYPGETPTKDADAQYTYTFSGWTDGTNSYGLTDTLPAVTGNVTYTATYDTTVKSYTITWKNDDGNVIDTTTVAYGTVPTHADPTKAATAQYTYTFNGWNTTPVAVTGEATYTATFSSTLRSYTITWNNDDGSLIDTTTVAYGIVPTHADATKSDDDQYTYTFAGWNTTPVAVTGEATYTATFTATPKQSEPPVNNLQDFMSVRIDDQIYIKYILHNRENLGSVTVTYYDQDGVKVLQEQSYTVDQLTFGEDGTFVILAEVAPAQIGDTVTVTITTSDGNPPTTYETSIAQYCEYLIANYNGNDAAAVTALAKATLEYGQAANDYFAGTGFYNASEITTITEALSQENIDAAKAQNNLAITGDVSNMLAGASFMALTKPEFRFYFNNSLTDEKAVQLNENHQITTNDEDVTAWFYKNPETGAILLEVKGIKAEDMDKVITITVGDLGTITFSGNDFARMMANSNNQAIKTLGLALYLYGVKAKACFTPNQEG